MRAKAYLTLKVILALAILGGAVAKLYGPPSIIEEFNVVGLGQWFRYFTAAIEIVGALLLVVPGTAFSGAVILTLVCVGAFFAQLLALHGDIVHTLVMAAIFIAIAWVERNQSTLLQKLKP
jgi:putative oxidoreductase